MRRLTEREAIRVLQRVPLKYLPKSIDLDQFRIGYPVEMEHRDVTGGDPVATSRIVFAHLREVPDYYTRLLKYVERAGTQRSRQRPSKVRARRR